ncbi:CDP-glycerol glycerophosphotransferase family protein [Salinibacterium sp.]|uniref:CDP-glycerol glycerophosphotransferase family protein n=1 Tax=Salinibacterium sp. TaxID=1915057 RepID=UPI00286CCA0E|nr:CDP-glycerol glycerophosphotransferase family protein [Salinibacterium sp.]
MSIRRDIGLATRVVRDLIHSRSQQAEVARRSRSHPLPPPGSVKIAVYFADADVNMYQLRQWYGPLADLASTWPIAIIARSAGTALALWDEAPVPAHYLRTVVDLERFVHEQQISIVFYVNQNTRNFQMFRYGRMWHVFINHGESDKVYMTTNQFKAYDYSFIAGEAAFERLSHKLWDYDLANRAIMIGRPQADHLGGELPFAPDDRTVILYAPTWEGDRAGATYGSVVTHGVALVSALLATGVHRVIYRPHPRSGVVDPEYKAANLSIIAAIARANALDPGAEHVFDDSPQLDWQLSAADVAVTDISAMVYDRLATGKPLIITRPSGEAAEVDETGYLGAAEWLTADDASGIVAIIERVQVDEEARRRLQFWVERHFGDTSPGSATRRFRDATARLMERWEEHRAIHDADDDDDDDFDDDSLEDSEEDSTEER